MIVLKTHNDKVVKESKEELNKKLLRESVVTKKLNEAEEEEVVVEEPETEEETPVVEGEATRMDVLKSVVDYFSAAIETAENEDIEVDLDELVENVSAEFDVDAEVISTLVEGLYSFLFDDGEVEAEGEEELENTEGEEVEAEGEEEV